MFAHSHARKSEPDGLTPQERKFVEAVTSGMTPRQAYRQGGFPMPSSQGAALDRKVAQLLSRPVVADAIRERQLALRAKYNITRDDIVKGVLEAIKDAKLLSDPATQLTGWRDLAKMLGLNEPEHKIVTIAPEVELAQKQLSGLHTEDLLRLAGPGIIEAEFTLIQEDPEDASGSHYQDRP